MAVWVVRAGKHGEGEATALEQNMVVIGWAALPDLAAASTREKVEELYRAAYLDVRPGSLATGVGQVHAFRNRIQDGDIVLLPLKSRSAVAIGRIAGGYKYRADLPPDALHTRPVTWLRTDAPRNDFDQDLLFSMGSLLTVFQVARPRAVERILAIADGSRPPVMLAPTADTVAEGDGASRPNLEEVARDQIRGLLATRYKGHELARLVGAVLAAQGYRTYVAPPGADGGVDIIAGQGPMGFDPPRLCVQVKSSDQPLDVAPLRELQGVLKKFGAEQGLLIAWGGFKSSVHKEARQLFFEVRLWDADDLVEALLENFDRLPADLRAELPLKRIWVLVPDEG